MGGRASTPSETTKPPKNDYPKKQSAENIPSIFVDYQYYHLLNNCNFEREQRHGEVYEIGGKRYTDVENACEAFEEFKLYAEKIDTTDEVIDAQPEKLDMEVQDLQFGYIINSAVYLLYNEFNTIIELSDNCMQCFVCGAVLSYGELDSHVETEEHQKNLDLYAPLDEFGSDIIRQKNNHYHCGVCSEVFHKEMCTEHFEGTNHTNNVTSSFAIAYKINNNLEEFRISEIYAKNNDGKNINNDNGNMNNDNVNKNNDNMNRDNDDLNKNNDNFNKNNDNFNKNNDTKNENDSASVKNANEDVTKDWMLNSLVPVNTKKRVFEIEYLIWNMIYVSKSALKDTFYCMACKMNDFRVNLVEHVNEMSHKNNLERFKINDFYGDHLIRQDEKWSHCSTCNTIHYIDGTDIHIAEHKKKTQTYAESLKTIPKSKPENKTNVVQNNINKMNVNNHVPSTSAAVAKSNENIINDYRNKNNDRPKSAKLANTNENNDLCSTSANVAKTNENIINDIVAAITNEKCYVFLFGFKIQVSLLSLNVIFRNAFGFYCLICKLNFLVQHIYDHLKSPFHTYMLNSTPAIQHFGYNYIRSIDNVPHCGICHLIVQPNILLIHLQDTTHILMTNIALGISTPQPPIAIITPNVKNDSKNINNDSQNTRNTNENIRNETNGNDRNITEELSSLQLRNDPIQTEDTSFNDGNIINDINMLTKDMSNLHISEEARADDQIRNAQTVNNENIFNDKNANTKLSKDIRKDDEKRSTQTNNNANIVNENNERTVKNVYAKINDETLHNIEYNEIAIHDIPDLEVQIILRCSYSEISWTTYNTLVPIGDGDRYCFLCEKRVILEELVDHIRSEPHMKMISQTKFVEYYSTSLIRQKSALYHCAICNAILRQSDLEPHIEWTIHDEQRKLCNTKIKKAERKTMKQKLIVPLQKDITYDYYNEINEPKIKITLDISFKNNNGENDSENSEYEKELKKNKLILLEGYNLKLTLDWEAWHSILGKKQKYTCLICNEKLNEIYIEDHLASEKHKLNLLTPFLKSYFPSLLRQVSENIVNCAICNTAIYDTDAVVAHLRGAKHKNKYESALALRPENNSDDILTV